MTTSVVIPNYNGEKLLQKNLPHVLKIGADEVIIVDDGSSDQSVAYVKTQNSHSKSRVQLKSTTQNFKIIQHKKNLGFAKSVNDGFRAARGDVVVLLNTDVEPKESLLEAVLPHFENPDVFAVSFNEGKWSFVRGVFHHGLIEFRSGGKTKKTRETFWASGGSAAFNRKKWNALGGMDPVYSPFYWEDTDISYRAQIRGWKILWEPKARVEHEHEATTGRTWWKKRVWVVERNQLIFFWKNISSPKLWTLHLLWLPYRLFPPGRFIPFFLAIIKLPRIIFFKIKDRGRRKLSDEEILAKFN